MSHSIRYTLKFETYDTLPKRILKYK